MPNVTCTLDGCGKTHVARGLCAGHYRRWSLNGEGFDRSPLRHLPPKGTLCSLPGCERGVYAKALCNPHWQRQHLSGGVGSSPIARRAKHGLTLRERFDLYGHAAPTTRGCIEWEGHTDDRGYGIINFGGVVRTASRAAWEVAHGGLTENLVVRHKCDNPPCVNLEHLEIGTTADNVNDMVSRDRHTRGERSGTAKLTDAEVLEIRDLAAQGQSHRAIAEAYSVGRRHVGDIINRICWKHL